MCTNTVWNISTVASYRKMSTAEKMRQTCDVISVILQ